MTHRDARRLRCPNCAWETQRRLNAETGSFSACKHCGTLLERPSLMARRRDAKAKADLVQQEST